MRTIAKHSCWCVKLDPDEVFWQLKAKCCTEHRSSRIQKGPLAGSQANTDALSAYLQASTAQRMGHDEQSRDYLCEQDVALSRISDVDGSL